MIITTIVAFYVMCGLKHMKKLLSDTTKKVVLQMSMRIENDIPTNFYGNYFNRTSRG